MKNNGYINNRLRMNIMIKKNNIKKIKNDNKKLIKRNNSSQRYLDMYQNEKTLKTNLRTPDVNKNNNNKRKKVFEDIQTIENKSPFLFEEKEEEINKNFNLLSNSFDISRSFTNIEDYMNLFYISGNKNPFINKTNESNQKEKNEINEIKIKEQIIAKYSYKNKNWFLIEEFDNNNKSINLYWKEYSQKIFRDKNNIQDFNILEEKNNSLNLENNKIKQLFNDLNNKYEQISKKYNESKVKLNYYLLKIKEIEKDKEKYLKKNKKLKEEINKIPFLIEHEMNKFREEAGKKISKKIYDLEQENKILKGERYKSNERKKYNEYELKFNGYIDENIINKKKD